MPADPVSTVETAPVSAERTHARKMGPRERNRKLLLLTLLVVALAALSYSAYYFTVNRSVPIPGIAPEGQPLDPPSYLFSITGTGAQKLLNPVGVALGRDGRVYVVDFDRRRIAVFTGTGNFLFAFNKIADGANTELGNPVHLVADKDGNIWVTDRRLKAIYIFSPAGKYLRKFLPDGKADFVWSPLALAFDADGGLKVTDVGDTAKHRVLYFDPTGKLVTQFGRTVQVDNSTAEPGAFYFPNGLAVSDSGDVYVSDGDNRRVQVFDKTGAFKQFVATSGVPRGAAIDGEDRLYVVDALAHQVDIYSLKGETLTKFGEQGFGPGQFNYPNDVTIQGNRIYVTDRENDQVQVWGWPTGGLPPLRPPSTPLGWLFCLSPLLLLPLLLLARRKRFTVTEDFVDALVAAGEVKMLAERRFRFVVPESEHDRYAGRVEDGVSLGDVIQPERHSASDAKAIAAKLEVPEATAVLLAVASRTKGLCTESVELRRLALALEIAVFNRELFAARFRRESSHERE